VPAAEPDAPAAGALPGPLALHGEGPLATLLQAWLGARGIDFTRVPVSAWTGLKTPAVELRITDGRTATHVAAEIHQPDLAVIDVPAGAPLPGKATSLAIAFAFSASLAARDSATATLRACGWQPRELRDVPGLWAARTLAMLVNEGADAVSQGVCDEAGADTAMKLGTNWPAGPFEWLQRFGIEAVVTVLDHLHAATRNERYRVSPLLQQRLWAQRLVTRS
jgi:3-hydroxybutyryl-CoA dehydrogenase